MKVKLSKLIKSGNSLYVYIPASLAKDSNFPFNEGDKVQIRIKEDSLVINKNLNSTTDRQEENKSFLDSLLKNPDFIAQNPGKWVVVTDGKLLEIVEDPKNLLKRTKNISTPILMKQIGRSRRNRTVQWLGGSLQ